MKKTLWTRNFSLVTIATALGAIGGVASEFALSFLVFDETGSTLASALILAIQCVPCFLIQPILAPFMDRLPRKPFLVGGDVMNCVLYAVAGVYLLKYEFSYIGYLCFSLLLASLSSFDMLAYDSIYPKLIPDGMEEKGYTVSSMLYPVLRVLMTPVVAILYDKVGVGWILIVQSGLSLSAAITESFIRVKEERVDTEKFSFRLWWNDILDTVKYLKQEKGLRSIFSYIAVTNGIASGYSPLMVAAFRTLPGLTMAMYSLFSGAIFIGRTIGGAVRYITKIPAKKRFGFSFFVYMTYEAMDMVLMWSPYPLMLVNRVLAGFLGINSATLRQAATQRYLPERFRSRVRAYQFALMTALEMLLTLLLGALGEWLDPRLCVTIGASISLVTCLVMIWRRRNDVRKVYEA